MSGTALGAWVELHEESCSGGERVQRLLVNRRERVALTLTATEAELVRSLAGGESPDAAFVSELRAEGFLADSAVAPAPPVRRFNRLRTFATTLDVQVTSAGPLIASLYRRGARLAFTRWGIALQVCLAVVGLVAVLRDLASPSTVHLQIDSAQIPAAIALSLFAIAVHEGAHALVVIHNGRRIDAIGFRLHLGTPAFYVESIDALLLSRRQRIVQAAAGSWAEWGVTSLVAIWVWVAPTDVGLALLYRFVVLNCITIGSNVLPFVGLDGFLVFADVIGEPDLSAQVRGAVTTVLRRKLSGGSVTKREWLVAGYAAVNGAVATVLLMLSGLFWYALFGDAIATLLASGFWGTAALVVLAFVILRPAVRAAIPVVTSAAATAAELATRLHFRLQWRWRVPAATALAELEPAGPAGGEQQLGIIAGGLVRHRIGRSGRLPHDLAGLVYLERGAVETVEGRLGVHRRNRGRALASGLIVSGRPGTVLVSPA